MLSVLANPHDQSAYMSHALESGIQGQKRRIRLHVSVPTLLPVAWLEIQHAWDHSHCTPLRLYIRISPLLRSAVPFLPYPVPE